MSLLVGHRTLLTQGSLFLAILVALLTGGQSAEAGMLTLTVSSTANTGPMTLRQAIESTNANGGADEITFDPSVFPAGSPATITLTTALPEINGREGITISGAGAGVVIDGATMIGGGDGLRVTGGSDSIAAVNIRDLVVRGFPGAGLMICGGTAPDCIEAASDIEVDGVTANGNGAEGILIRAGSLSDVIVRNCIALSNTGSGILVESEDDSIDSLSITGCDSDQNGSHGSRVVSSRHLTDFLFDANSFEGNGGNGLAMFVDGDLTGADYTNNTASGNFSGYTPEVADTATDIEFSNNRAEGNGNGVGVDFDTNELADAAFRDNTIAGNQGVLGLGITANIVLENVSIVDNTVTNNKGAGISVRIDDPESPAFGPNFVERNTVTGNTGDGVQVLNARRVTISRNQIYDNGKIGINLRSVNDPVSGVTLNDGGDSDVGPNTLLNFPDLTGITNDAIQGTACSGCTVELFLADDDPSGYGEGRTFLVDGQAPGGSFSIQLDGVCAGDLITATATDSNGNTSEFSLNFEVTEDIECSAGLIWGNADCSPDGIRSRDAQAIGKFVLQGTPLTQSDPCPEVGQNVTVNGTQRMWGNWDCSADGVRSRDAQATGRFVLQGSALSQTQPCPVVGSQVTVTQ